MKIRWTEATEQGSLLNYLHRFAACISVVSTVGKSGQKAERVIKSMEEGPNHLLLHRPGLPPHPPAHPLSRKLKATAVKHSGSRDKTNSMEDDSDIICRFLPFRGQGPFRICYHSNKQKRSPNQYFGLHTLRPLLGLLPHPPTRSASRTRKATAVKHSGARDKTNSMQDISVIRCKFLPFRIQGPGQPPFRVCY